METPSTARPLEEDQPGQLGKPTAHALPLGTEESGGPGSWQTDSLASSWATVGTLDPDEPKSLEASDVLLLAEERSENHSSISDIVHLEREEAELFEEQQRAEEEEEEEVRVLRDVEVEEEDEVLEDEEDMEALQSSTISVLGTEKELAELEVEQGPQELRVDMPRHKAPQAEKFTSTPRPELLEEPEEVIWPLSSTPPPAISEPPVLARLPESVPVVAELKPVTEVLSSLPKLAQEITKDVPKALQEVKVSKLEIPIPTVPPAPPAEVLKEAPPPPPPEPVAPPVAVEEKVDVSAHPVPSAEEPKPSAPKSSAFELPTVLYGSAALVAIMGMAAYGALALSRK